MSDAPIAREGAGRSIYRASFAGSCLRSLVASRLGYEPLAPSDDLEVIFKEGHRHEPLIIEDLRAMGYDIAEETDDGEQFTIQIETDPSDSTSPLIEGHVDGLTTDGEFVVECKALSQNSFEKWEKKAFNEFHKYAVQITIYMTATGRKGLYAVKNRNTGRLDVRILETPPLDIGDILAHVQEADRSAARGDLPPCTVNDFFCPFRYLHENGDTDSEIDEAINDVAARYVAAREAETEARKAKDEARDLLLLQIGERERVESGLFKVTKTIVRRVKFERDRLLADHGDDFLTPYEVEQTSEQLRVSAKNVTPKESNDA